MEPVAAAGWTTHNVAVLRQHTVHMELEVVGGVVSSQAKDSFLQGIKGIVEANRGEANRRAVEEDASAAAHTQAKSYKETLQRHATLEAFSVGKGKGKGNSQFPSTNPGRFTGIPKNNNTTEQGKAITALGGRARDALENDHKQQQQQQEAAAGTA